MRHSLRRSIVSSIGKDGVEEGILLSVRIQIVEQCVLGGQRSIQKLGFGAGVLV